MEGGAKGVRALLVTVVKAKKAYCFLQAQGGTCLPIPAPSDYQRAMILTGLSPFILYFLVAFSPSFVCPNFLPIRTPILLTLGPSLLQL